jgi:hypothetical protein
MMPIRNKKSKVSVPKCELANTFIELEVIVNELDDTKENPIGEAIKMSYSVIGGIPEVDEKEEKIFKLKLALD